MMNAVIELQEEELLYLALGAVHRDGARAAPATHVQVPLAGGRSVILPWGQGRTSWRAASVYLPYRMTGRLRVALGAAAAAAGGTLPSCLRLRLDAEGSFLWRLCIRHWREPFHFAVYTGTAGPGRKWTVRVMDAEGNALAYAKVAACPAARLLLQNEGVRLADLAEVSGLVGRVPEAIGFWEEDGVSVLLLSPLEGRRVPLRFSADVSAFLDLLPSRGRVRLGDHPLFAKLDATLAGTEREEEWDREQDRLADLEVTWAYQHGDFAPWNLRRTERGLVCFDWEAARPDGIRELDEIHWHHMVARTLGRRRQLVDGLKSIYPFYVALLSQKDNQGAEGP